MLGDQVLFAFNSRVRGLQTPDVQCAVCNVLIADVLGSLSKLKNLCARTFFAFVQLSGENPMSHLMSPVFRFQLEAELRLNLCAEPKNMANSTLKCHFKVALSGNLDLCAHQISFGRARNFLVDFTATIYRKDNCIVATTEVSSELKEYCMHSKEESTESVWSTGVLYSASCDPSSISPSQQVLYCTSRPHASTGRPLCRTMKREDKFETDWD